MIDRLAQFKLVLKQHNQSLTGARLIVFETMLDKEPQTMQAITKACDGQVNRASVYRVLNLFEQLGIVQRLQVGWKYTLELTDIFHRHHHHLTCLRCGKIIPLDEDSHLEQHLDDAALRYDFVMKSHQLEIQGLCSNCKPM